MTQSVAADFPSLDDPEIIAQLKRALAGLDRIMPFEANQIRKAFAAMKARDSDDTIIVDSDGIASSGLLPPTAGLTSATIIKEPNMSEQYEVALANWKEKGGARPKLRPDNIPTRIDTNWMTPAELAIKKAMAEVEMAGGSLALTEAITWLAKARDKVADHVEGVK